MLSRRTKAGMILAGVTPQEMAHLFRVTPRTWRNWMADPYNHLTVGQLDVIARRLGVKIENLLEEEA